MRVIAVRNVSPEDAHEAADLSAELGYPVPAETMEKRLAEIARASDHSVFGAYLEGRLVGWIDVGIVQHLQSGKYGEIGGLIVSAKYQGCGIGKALVKAAEEWVAEREIDKILVRSQVVREEAHAFYIGLNFSRIKTSAVFSKSLAIESRLSRSPTLSDQGPTSGQPGPSRRNDAGSPLAE